MSVRKLAMVAYRALQLAFLGLVVAHAALDLGYPWWWNFLPIALAYVILSLANRWGGAPDSPRAAREPVEVEPPVTGRWTALNSPADRTPSHGTHAYGQTYAIDVVAEPEPGARPGFSRLWPLARRNSAFPAYGAPLLAVADGTVVRAADGQRDHLSRTSPLALLYLMVVEASVRDLSGAGRVIGNHVVLDLGNGTYALYAHLQRGSLAVREGDRVTAGQPLARCGNSGNSTEPHLHFQLMDGPDPDTARGLPFTWRGIGVPRNGETFETPAAASQPA
ncbi:murein DD-endopeptidase MepM/ murein hydrolase activator NlpD [Streptomyces africanus]|uniref:Murein DD-endopeptidase MepM/ murein hydrolase activator NlpD n=1 Tax=Streptomyces africanus TaxID=231024 RepID=A0ABU0QQC1_9ACTN|nr:M23 family metallopeptidase [Streptomyces africanus]MDQ0749578.1 murein DD-endopeptidase MepM/ murein hydrolase activator NlpD [Streptomyces africanus]